MQGLAELETHGWDLAVAVSWYADDVDRLFAAENDWALDAHGFDHILAAAALLGKDVRDGLSPAEADVLAARVVAADPDLLAEHFVAGVANWPRQHRERRQVVDALFAQIAH